MTTSSETIEQLAQREYKYGFTTDIEQEFAPPGLNEEVIRFISAKKAEPDWLLEWRLKAYRHWKKLYDAGREPQWAFLPYGYGPIDYQAISYYAAPKKRPESMDDVDPELLRTYEKLGIPLEEQKWLAGVAVDAVFDSVSVATTFQKELEKHGIIFCSFSEAVRAHPELVKKYLGTVVPHSDNFFAALNSAVFSDGSFAYVPKGVRCPMELSTYFRINAAQTGQFERTLIVADEGSYVSYMEGCTAPMRDENQLHAAVVELVALDDATIKYSTIQNWYPGDEEGKGGIYNFVTKRGKCAGRNSHISCRAKESGKDDLIDSFVGSIAVSPIENIKFGASYTSNIAGSDSFSEAVVDPDNLDSLVGGWSAFVTLEFLERFKLIGEYVGALDNFKTGEVYDAADTKERKPLAWNVELGVAIIDNLELAVRYDGSDDGGSDFLPESQYGAVLNWGFFKNTNLALEYLHGEFEDDAQDTDSFVAQLAIEF